MEIWKKMWVGVFFLNTVYFIEALMYWLPKSILQQIDHYVYGFTEHSDIALYNIYLIYVLTVMYVELHCMNIVGNCGARWMVHD